VDYQGGGGAVLKTPRTSFLPHLHTYSFEDGITVQLGKFEDRRDGLTAEATFLCDGTLIQFGKLNLSSAAARKTQAKTLAESHPAVKLADWTDALLNITYTSTEQWRTGTEPVVDLATVEMDYEREVSLLEPLIPLDGIVVDFGDGSAGKSLFVLAQLATIASGKPILGMSPTETGNVLLCDWEDSPATHHERLAAVCAGANITIPEGSFLYQRMDRSLIDSLSRLQKDIKEHDIKCIAIDSLGMACGGDPSDAQLIIQSMVAAQQLGIPTIMIHHISAEMKGKESERPYGSIYVRNAARMLFRLDKKQELDLDESKVYVTNTKANRGRLRSRMAWDVEFVNDDKEHMQSVTYTRALANDYEEEMKKPANQMSVKDFLIQTFDENPTSAYSVARLKDLIKEDLGKEIKENSLRNTLSRGKNEGLFYIYKTDDNGTNWWQLAEAAPDAHPLL